MIYEIKDDPILQDSSQEPSTSSKYRLQGQGVLDTILIMLESWNLAHKSWIDYHGYPVKQDFILQLPSQEPSMSTKYGLWGQEVLDTSNQDR